MSNPLRLLHQVDEEMRQELAKLKLVVDKEKGGKGTAKVEQLFQRDLPGGGQIMLITLCVDVHFTLQKKKGAKSGKKKKKEKDLTSDR